MNKSLHHAITYFAIVVTVLAQFADGVSAAVYLPLWGATLLVAVQSGGGAIRLGNLQMFIILLFCVMGACACLALVFTGEQGYVTGFFTLALKSVLLYFVGWFLSCHFSADKNEERILLVYIAAAFAYAAWVVITYVPSFTAWAQSQQYLFAQKNSFGQIAGVAALCSIYVSLRNQSHRMAFFYAVVALCLFVAIALVQCRTAILAFCAGILVLMCLRRKKRLLLLLLGGIALALMINPTIRTFFAHALFLDKYSGADLNSFSSGRSDLWAVAVKVWLDNALIGTGSYYVDNFYLNALANVGIVGTLLMLGVWASRIVTNVRCAVNPVIAGRLYFSHLACSLTAFYLVESLLEGQPPFGPGSSSFLFWLISGMLDGQVKGNERFEMDKSHG